MTAELSFWKGSVSFAATIILLLVGKHYASRETLNYLQVVIGPSISRVLRYAVSSVAEKGTSIAVTLSLDPSSVAQIEQMQSKLRKGIDRFERRTDILTKYVFYKCIVILLAGIFAMVAALLIGAPYWARRFDVLRSVAG